jgi:hypothetical protein
LPLYSTLSHWIDHNQHASNKQALHQALLQGGQEGGLELWRVKVSLATIRKQLKMSERSLWRILYFAKSNPDATVARRKRDPGSRTSNLNMTHALVEAIRKLLTKSPTLSVLFMTFKLVYAVISGLAVKLSSAGCNIGH